MNAGIPSLVGADLLGGFLIVAAAAKASRPRPALVALESISPLRQPASQVVLGALVATEWAVGSWLVLRPDAHAAQVAVAALFAAFALVGAYALATGRAIECGCFGGLRSTRLGWLQIAQLPIAVAMLAALAASAPQQSIQSGAAMLVLVNVAAGLALLLAAAPAWRTVRRDRISLAIGVEYMWRDTQQAMAAGQDGAH